MSQELFALIDGGLIMHSYHSGIDRDGGQDANGQKLNTPGHTLENFITRHLLPITEHVRLNRIIVVWDEGSEYRKRLSPEYKAKRQDKTPELKAAIGAAQGAVQEVLKALGILQVSVPGVEADDVLAWLSAHLPGKKTVYTLDADLLQLSNQDTVVFVAGAPVTGGYKRGEMTVPFHRVALYKSLCGDTSDGYGGVKGFGPAAWKKLVETYGDEGLQDLQDAVSKDDYRELLTAIQAEPGQHPQLEKLMEKVSEWRLGWALATLHPELVNAKYDGKFLRPKWVKRLPSVERLQHALASTGCSHLWTKLEPFTPKRWILDARGWEGQADLEEARKMFAASPFVSFDLETWAPENPAFIEAANGRDFVDMLSSRTTGAGFTFGRNLEYTFYSTYDHAGSENLPKGVLLDLLDAIPEGVPVVAHNGYFERTVIMAEFGCDIPNLHDTKIMSCHVDEEESHGLKDLALRILGYKQTRYSDVVEKGKTMRDYSADHVFSYGADDPFVTAHLYDFFYILLALEGTWEFVRTEEFDAIYSTSDAYLAGVDMDWEELVRQAEEDRETEEAAIARIRQLLEASRSNEAIAQGVANLWDNEYGPVLKAQSVVEGWDDERLKKEETSLRAKLYERVTYRPLVVREKTSEVKPTKSKIAPILERLGLPPFEGKTLGPRTIHDYLLQTRQAEEQSLLVLSDSAAQFLYLLGQAAQFLKDESSVEYREFVSHCAKLLSEALPDDKRYITEGTELNFGSPQQMVDLLYGTLGLPIRYRNMTVSATRMALGLDNGSVQANEDAIRMAIAVDCPDPEDWRRQVLELVLEAKKAQTRQSLFYSKYPLWKHPLTGLVHPQINSVGTETRRPSGSSPNPLQWPKKGEGVKFRRCVLPNRRLGHDLVVSIDWDQEELRLAAGLSLDPALSSCYIGADVADLLPPWVTEYYGEAQVNQWLQGNTRDVHSLTASGIATAYGLDAVDYEGFVQILKDSKHSLQKKHDDVRKDAKNINFGSTYDIGPTKLARKLLCHPDKAKEFLVNKKALYSGLEEWRAAVIDHAHIYGHVRTLLGSVRHVFSSIGHPDQGMRGHVERQVVNYLIQGLAADILKRTLRQTREQGVWERTGAKLIAPIYDELAMSVHHSQAVDLILSVHTIMTQHVRGLPVPLLAGPSLGRNFGDQVDIGIRPTREKIEDAIERVLFTATGKEAA